jgi:hypothetical protein
MAVTIIVGTNSWVTLAEANAYFEAKYNVSDEWAALTDTVKNQLLISAYNWINQQTIFSIPAASTAYIVKQAQFEAAWYLYKFGKEDEKRRALIGQGVTSFDLSQWSETLDKYEFPAFITGMLDDFFVGAGGYKVTFTRDY